MNANKTDVWVGFFVFAGLVALLFLALKVGNLLSLSFAPQYPLVAFFDNIGGLKANAAVKSAGVVVGRVAGIDLDRKSFRAKVTLEIDKGLALPRDTSAKILTSGLLGDQYVGLEPGGDEQDLAAGERIENTQSAIVLENLIGQFLYSKAADGGSKSGNGDGKQ